MTPPDGPPSLVESLRKRKLVQWAAAYAAGAWVALQVLALIGQQFDWPPGLLRGITITLGTGFFVTVVVAWFHGERGLQRTTRAELALLFAILALGATSLWYAERGRAPVATPTSAAGAGTAPEPVAAGHSLAVLPFKNMARNSPETDDFVDGMHDDLLTQLAKVGALKVISRTSVLQYRDSTKPIPAIARELHVANVLEGGIQRAGNRLRINVQLIDALTDQHVWAETYDRELSAENIFAVQGELARSIAQALRTTLTPAEVASTSRVLTANLDALDLYRRAMAIEADPGRLAETGATLDRALAIDDRFAAALALRAKTRMGEFWHARADPGLREAARHDLDRARALSPDLPELDIAEGYYHYWGYRDYSRALEFVDRALDAIPNEARLHVLRGFILRRTGRIDEGIAALERAAELDPRNAHVLAELIYANMVARQGTRAARFVEQALADFPAEQDVLYNAAEVEAWQRGDPVRATALLAASPTTWRNADMRYWLANVAGDLDSALGAAKLEGPVTQQYIRPPGVLSGLALLYAGKAEQARPELQHALADLQARLAQSPADRRLLQTRCLVVGALGQRKTAQAACAEARKVEMDDFVDRIDFELDIAIGLALAGADDEALSMIEATTRRDMGMPAARFELEPALRALREQPRFKAAMASVRERTR